MIVNMPPGVGLEVEEDGTYGNVYVQCQWGWCSACEPYPPYEPPEGWGVWPVGPYKSGDWYCPEHLKAARYEDALAETIFTVGVPQCFGKTLLKRREGFGPGTRMVSEVVE